MHLKMGMGLSGVRKGNLYFYSIFRSEYTPNMSEILDLLDNEYENEGHENAEGPTKPLIATPFGPIWPLMATKCFSDQFFRQIRQF